MVLEVCFNAMVYRCLRKILINKGSHDKLEKMYSKTDVVFTSNKHISDKAKRFGVLKKRNRLFRNWMGLPFLYFYEYRCVDYNLDVKHDEIMFSNYAIIKFLET